MKFKDNKDKIEFLEKAKRCVLSDIEDKYSENPFFDTLKVDIGSSEEYFNKIVDYCKTYIKEKAWSNNKSLGDKYRYFSTEGLAQKLERKFGWKVMNKWVKLAVINAGLDFMSMSKEDNYSSKNLSSVNDIFDDNIVFIFRYNGNSSIKLDYLNDYYG